MRDTHHLALLLTFLELPQSMLSLAFTFVFPQSADFSSVKFFMVQFVPRSHVLGVMCQIF